MQDLSDELPDNSPRFVLLSYPLTLVSDSSACGWEALRLMGWSGIWPAKRTIRDDQLHAHDMQPGSAHVVRWRERAYAESEWGGEDYRGRGGRGCGDDWEAIARRGLSVIQCPGAFRPGCGLGELYELGRQHQSIAWPCSQSAAVCGLRKWSSMRAEECMWAEMSDLSHYSGAISVIFDHLRLRLESMTD